MTRELSKAWYNVIRRQMRATSATEVPVPCTDCNGPTHLEKGRYGRFYACDRHYCKGTRGARLDGTPRALRGNPETLTARREAAIEVGRLLDIFHDLDVFYWISSDSMCERLLKLSGVFCIYYPNRRRRLGLERRFEYPFLRKRTAEEARKIASGAKLLSAEYAEKLGRVQRDAWSFLLFADDDGVLPIMP